MENPPTKAYGEGRTRQSVSYGEVERAAITLLKSERRPTVENIREALGRGSPDTIGNALKRFWRDLGVRIEGDPAALSRMPPDIADLADGMWQKALKLAGEAAARSDNGARERLAQIQIENELRAQSFELREREYDAASRAREKALADSREHLLLLMKSLGREQATVRAHEIRIADLQTQVEQYRQQLAALIAGAVVRHRSTRKPAGPRKKPPAIRRIAPRRPKAAKRTQARPVFPGARRRKKRSKLPRTGQR
jgi:Plasmid replication region DNA-binding N-term